MERGCVEDQPQRLRLTLRAQPRFHPRRIFQATGWAWFIRHHLPSRSVAIQYSRKISKTLHQIAWGED
jgi:hypothetical protein